MAHDESRCVVGAIFGYGHVSKPITPPAASHQYPAAKPRARAKSIIAEVRGVSVSWTASRWTGVGHMRSRTCRARDVPGARSIRSIRSRRERDDDREFKRA